MVISTLCSVMRNDPACTCSCACDHSSRTSSCARDITPTLLPVTNLTFASTFSNSIEGLQFATVLRRIEFGNWFNQPELSFLPYSLTQLVLGDTFSHPIKSSLDLPNLTHLHFGYEFNHPVDGLLPSSLTHLSFDGCFDQTIENLPSNLVYLKVGYYFNHPVDKLPSTLKSLVVADEIRYSLMQFVPHSVRHPEPGLAARFLLSEISESKNLASHMIPYTQCVVDLPPRVTHLVEGWSFNQLEGGGAFDQHALTFVTYESHRGDQYSALPPIRMVYFAEGIRFRQALNLLPPALTRFVTSGSFNGPVDKLPASLTHLVVGNVFNQPVDKLPSTLTHLITGYAFDQPVNRLPFSMIHLSVGSSFNRPVDNLPQSLTCLITGTCFRHPINNLPESLLYYASSHPNRQTVAIKFPPRLRQLTLDYNKGFIGVLPPTLTHLNTGEFCNYPILQLPLSLTHLTTGQLYNQPLYGLRNLNLTHITLGTDFNHPVDTLLPPSLLFLQVGTSFNQPVTKLPASLKFLQVGCRFNQPVSSLPLTMSHLMLCCEFNNPVDKLPRSLQFLQLGKGFAQPIDKLPPLKIIQSSRNHVLDISGIPSLISTRVIYPDYACASQSLCVLPERIRKRQRMFYSFDEDSDSEEIGAEQAEEEDIIAKKKILYYC